MRKLMEQILEKIITNAFWSVLTGLITILTPVIMVIINERFQETELHIVLYLTAIIISLCLVYLLRRIVIGKMPGYRWDVVHGKNEYILTFKNRSTAEYTKKIEVKPLRHEVKDFKDGKYAWSGSSSIPTILESNDFILKDVDCRGSSCNYTVYPIKLIKAYTKACYTLLVKLKDKNLSMNPINAINIKRPTQKITIKLIIPTDVPILNVRYIAETNYGEENRFINKNGVPKEFGGHSLKYQCYTFTMRNPKLFCRYAITWEWNTYR